MPCLIPPTVEHILPISRMDGALIYKQIKDVQKSLLVNHVQRIPPISIRVGESLSQRMSETIAEPVV
jgi:hypothetical protein